MTAAFDRETLFEWCPFCEERHDSAPCPSPDEIKSGCLDAIVKRPIKLALPENVVELPGLGKGERLG